MAQIIQFRDYQSPAQRERARRALQKHLEAEAMQIANVAFPSIFGYREDHEPEKSPA